MTRTTLFARMAGGLLVLLALAACDTGSDHAALNGTPDAWWSDNYFAMLQDANDNHGVSAGGNRPVVRMRLP